MNNTINTGKQRFKSCYKCYKYLKSKIVFKVKIIWTFICIICFSYQTISLLNEYLLGSTIVKIRVGRFQRENIPSVTICLPFYMSLEKGVKIDKSYEDLYMTYKK